VKKVQVWCAVGSVALMISSVLMPTTASSQALGGNDFPNATGVARTVSTNGQVTLSGPFFQDLGSNGRRCVTCHQPGEGWAISAAGVKDRFERSEGLDPIFRLNDGSNSPSANISTVNARRQAFSMLMTKGLIRVERPIPSTAEYKLFACDDPYGYASSTGLSLFRRPLPSTNLGFISTVMWDGREVSPLTPMTISNSLAVNKEILLTSLSQQALDATNGHAEAIQNLTLDQRRAIVDFELGLATAQVNDIGCGSLMAEGALGGPENVTGLPFYIGINDNVADPGGPFKANAMTLFDAWTYSPDARRRSVARGQEVFNTKPIVISGVKGLNDNPYFGRPATVVGTCTTCHNTPNMGNHSLAVALDIGLTDASRRTADMPLYTLINKRTHEKVQTTDPGLALSTGKWSDIGRFKGPILRALSSRAPYFHNGSAADLGAVVDFYEERFGIGFTAQERADLIAFLRSL
jgi:cytochrome c peroxidase